MNQSVLTSKQNYTVFVTNPQNETKRVGSFSDEFSKCGSSLLQMAAQVELTRSVICESEMLDLK